ncbi:MAG: hypothetical protein HYW63_01675 [Candidatus Levybacteria bacterium]|nr:hypothetical protein [Candidatus Levybacteria bacterium]
MKIIIFGKSSDLEDLLIIIAYILILILIAALIWILISPFLAVLVSILVSYLFYLRKIIGRK